jgi:adenylosuccinate lyase
MPAHIFDSLIFHNSWSTEESRAIFDDVPRTRAWLEIVAVLAESQAEAGLIPEDAADGVARTCRELDLDAGFFTEVREGFEATNHSMLGLIRAVQRRCFGETGEWLYYGATVQDVTDTWMMMALGQIWTIVFRDLRKIEANLLDLAEGHRETIMAGRTHGQQGLPITFGYKAAVWAREIRRHLERLKEVRKRLGVAQLSGGVGTLSSLGPRGFEVQEKFAQRLALRPPLISWITARDVIVEWFQLLTLVSGSADKIGHEVYNLQRPEIAEISEGFKPGTVGSITMPHKRNPEIAEHLGTLARVIRHDAALIAESQVHDNERDGRAWKAEWAVLAEACMAACKLLELLEVLTANLIVHPDRALENLQASKGSVLSEAVMLALAQKVGKQTAHELVYDAAMRAHETGRSLREVVLETEAVRAQLPEETIETLFDYERQLGLCRECVDRVVAAARRERATEEDLIG